MDEIRDEWTVNLILLAIGWLMAPVFWWLTTNKDNEQKED